MMRLQEDMKHEKEEFEKEKMSLTKQLVCIITYSTMVVHVILYERVTYTQKYRKTPRPNAVTNHWTITN